MGFFKALGEALKLHPKTKEELKGMIDRLTSGKYPLKSLNFINVSSITDMSHLFEDSEWDGDISSWDVSHVTNMERMFRNSKFNGDISKWDVSNVENMEGLFSSSEFNGDISKWNVSKVTNMRSLFYGTKFTGDISGWDVSNVENMKDIFRGSKFKGNIFNWHIDKVQDVSSLWDGGWSPEDSQMLKNHFCRETTEPNKSEKQTAAQETTQNFANEKKTDLNRDPFGGAFGEFFSNFFGQKTTSQPAETKKETSESKPKSAGTFSGASGNYFVDSRDGQKYRTVKIGNQIWMAENLRYRCKSGCYAYDDDEDYVKIMGRLYEWDVVEGACPPGWHLPEDREWSEFRNCVGLDADGEDERVNNFRKIIVKPWAENLDIIPHLDEKLPPSRYRDLEEKRVNQQLKEINALKFSLVPSGRRDYNALSGKPSYSDLGLDAYFWNATLLLHVRTGMEDERRRKFFDFGLNKRWDGEKIWIDCGDVLELDPYPCAFSIRCIKD